MGRGSDCVRVGLGGWNWGGGALGGFIASNTANIMLDW